MCPVFFIMPVTDQGVSLDRYMLIPRVLIFIRRDSSVLLLKGAPSKRLWAGKYNGVGGHVERGEGILSAARRELFEETGLTSDLWLCGVVTIDTGKNPGVSLFVFSGTCQYGQPVPSGEGTLEWVPSGNLSSLPTVEDLPALWNRTHEMKPGDPPFSAHSYYDDHGNLKVEFTDSNLAT